MFVILHWIIIDGIIFTCLSAPLILVFVDDVVCIIRSHEYVNSCHILLHRLLCVCEMLYECSM